MLETYFVLTFIGVVIVFFTRSTMLFRVGGNIESLVIKNVHYHGSLAHDLLQAGGSYTGEGPAAPGMPSRIENLCLENVYVHGDTNAHDYIFLPVAYWKIRKRLKRTNRPARAQRPHMIMTRGGVP